MSGSDGALRAGSALLFALGAGATWQSCTAMAAMPPMSMPGGWSMSMMWMRMPGQTWLDAAAQFIAMWIPMMAAMMLPVLAPALQSHRRVVAGATGVRLDGLSTAVAAGYFAVWSAIGIVVFPLGALAANAAMRHAALAQAVPPALGALAVLAGALQFGGWKKRGLACWRAQSGAACGAASDMRSAWRHGVRLGLHCAHCCAGPTVVLLAVGCMEPAAMVLAALAIALERRGEGMRAAHGIGIAAIAAGGWAIGASFMA